MSGLFTLKVGDTSPRLDATLADGDDNPIDLTGVAVRFRLRRPRSGDVVIDEFASVVDAESGGVRYSWDASDTDEAGRFRAEFVVEYPDETIETFPNDGFHDIVLTH